MAKVLNGFVSQRPEYPWTEWTDGRPRLANRGVDFHCDVRGFKSTLTSYARRNGFIVKTAMPSDTEVSFQFSRKSARMKRRTRK